MRADVVTIVPATTPDAFRLGGFTVGDWVVDPKACHLARRDASIKLRPQLVDLLVCLARRAGEIVLKEEILAEVWPGQFIAESGLSRCVAELRQIFQDDAQQPRFIETVPKRGYRLVAPVTWLDEEKQKPSDGSEESRRAAPPASEAAGPGSASVPRARRRLHAWVGIALGLAAAGIVTAIILTRSPSASVLTEKDVVLLAFENQTGDAVFDEVVPLAMAIQMEQTPYLGLLSSGRIQETLRMMQRPPDTPITRAIGMEVCERVGGRVLIVTSIASLGRQYAVGLEAVACGTGRVLARRQVTASGKEQVLVGLQRAAVEIRRAVGEPAASLERYNVPIVEATTPSLEALRALRRGDVAREQGRGDLAMSLYREATRLDPDFALAYSRIGMTVEVDEAATAATFQKAYELRERVTFPERLEIEAMYHRFITYEQAKVIEALESLTRTYPRRALYRRALANEHSQSGRYEAALAESLEAQRLEPNSLMNLAAVARAYLRLNRIPEARASAETAAGVSAMSGAPHVILFQCALQAGDRDLLARERRWAADHRDLAMPYFVLAEAEESMRRGRLREAIGFLQQFEAWASSNGGPVYAAMARMRMARWEALGGKRRDGVRRLDEDLQRGLPPRARVDALKVLISAGEFDRAARLLHEVESDRFFVRAEPEATFIRAYRATIDAVQGRTEQAFSAFEALEPLDLGYAYGFIPLYERALAYERAGNNPKARAAFEKLLAHPTIDSGAKLLPLAELGIARTLAREGDLAGSRAAYERVLATWKDADPDLPVLRQARREYEALDAAPRLQTR